VDTSTFLAPFRPDTDEKLHSILAARRHEVDGWFAVVGSKGAFKGKFFCIPFGPTCPYKEVPAGPIADIFTTTVCEGPKCTL
jgi:hypothetical protein